MGINNLNFDIYLSEPPDDGYDSWCLQVDNSFDDDFYNQNIDFIHGKICALLYNELFCQGLSPQEAAKHITENLKTKL